MEHILFENTGGIAKITLNRPKAFNSFNRQMALEMQEALDECQNDESIRAVVITGEGKAFCAGQDLGEVTNPDENPGFEKILDEHYGPIIRKIRATMKPILAAVNGVAAGAGANIALACDVVIARESASFIQAFSAIGLIPDSGGTFFLPRLIGFQKASALAMLADKVSAQEAERLGMIYKYVADDEFDEKISATAKKLASLPTRGLALTKEAFNASFTNSLDAQLDIESKLQILASRTEDYAEGVEAFMEKRKPEFKGK